MLGYGQYNPPCVAFVLIEWPTIGHTPLVCMMCRCTCVYKKKHKRLVARLDWQFLPSVGLILETIAVNHVTNDDDTTTRINTTGNDS